MITYILEMNLPYANKMLAFSGFDKKNKRTKHNDSDINMFLSSFVLCCDGISARVSSQAHRNCYNRGSFSRFHLITIKKEKKKKTFIIIIFIHMCKTQAREMGSDHRVSHNAVSQK